MSDVNKAQEETVKVQEEETVKVQEEETDLGIKVEVLKASDMVAVGSRRC